MGERKAKGVLPGSPAYTRMVRERLESLFGPEHEELLELLAQCRPRVMERFPENEQRRREVWQQLANWEMVDLLGQGRWEEVEKIVAAALA